MTPDLAGFQTLYAAFNRREIEAVLACLAPTVEWANGMEGGFVYGHVALRDYWTQQWTQINPTVEPTQVTLDEAGHYVVDVHQTVRDLNGNLLADQMVQHLYTLTDGLVSRMEIQKFANNVD